MDEAKKSDDKYLSPERPRNIMNLFDLTYDNDEEYSVSKKAIIDEFYNQAFTNRPVEDQEDAKILIRSNLRKK